MQNQAMNEFSMRELFFFLKKKLVFVLLLAMVGGIGGYIWGKTQVKPIYVAESQIYVLRENDQVDNNSLQTAVQLRRDCELLLVGRNVTESVIERMGLAMTHEYMVANITITSVDNTRILRVTYQDTDPKRAAEVLNTFCQVGAEEIKDIMSVDVVRVLYEADPPIAPVSGGAAPYATGGLVGGIVVALSILIIYFLVDDTIRNEEDVERYLELPTLAAIPISSELGGGTKAKATKKTLGSLVAKRKG